MDAVWQAEARRVRAVKQEEAREDVARQAEFHRTQEARQEEARQSEQDVRMIELAKEEAATSPSTLSPPNAPTTAPHLNPSSGALLKNQAKNPCFSWVILGACQFGSTCRYDRNVNVRRPLSSTLQAMIRADQADVDT